jgi:hypothetical protein
LELDLGLSAQSASLTNDQIQQRRGIAFEELRGPP